ALGDIKLSVNETAAYESLKKWDFVAEAEGVAPMVFHATINAMVKQTLKKRLGEELYALYLKNNYMVLNSMRNLVAGKQGPWFDDPDTPVVEDLDTVIIKSFKDAIAYLDATLGSTVDEWQWGKLHTLTIYHPFGKSSPLMGYFMNIGPVPVGGGIATVNPQPYRLSNPWEVYHGASLRYIIDFADLKNSRRVIPAGISGNFMSPHYDDQVELWRNGRYRPFVLDRKSVTEDARYRLKMLPE
ncbi:MAG: penicillin acylase family protein, partial [Desulfobacterales bacterium]